MPDAEWRRVVRAGDVQGVLDRTRLDFSKNVERRETEIRQEVAQRGADELQQYIAGCNQRIGKTWMPAASHPLIAADFQKAIKSKRTVKSLNDSVDAELARLTKLRSELVSMADRLPGPDCPDPVPGTWCPPTELTTVGGGE